MIVKLLRYFFSVIFVFVISEGARAHEPVALEDVPDAVSIAVKKRISGITITEAEVDTERKDMIYVIKGLTEGNGVAIEVTTDGMIIEVYDREYYEDNIED